MKELSFYIFKICHQGAGSREQGEVTMAGLMFTLSILSILATVGFLFAWMVRLASNPERFEQKNDSSLSNAELVSEPVRSINRKP